MWAHLMTKGSLVVLATDDQKAWITGIVIKGPYGAVIREGTSTFTRETSVVDVLFHTQVFKKVPVDKLKTLK